MKKKTRQEEREEQKNKTKKFVPPQRCGRSMKNKLITNNMRVFFTINRSFYPSTSCTTTPHLNIALYTKKRREIPVKPKHENNGLQAAVTTVSWWYE